MLKTLRMIFISIFFLFLSFAGHSKTPPSSNWNKTFIIKFADEPLSPNYETTYIKIEDNKINSKVRFSECFQKKCNIIGKTEGYERDKSLIYLIPDVEELLLNQKEFIEIYNEFEYYRYRIEVETGPRDNLFLQIANSLFNKEALIYSLLSSPITLYFLHLYYTTFSPNFYEDISEHPMLVAGITLSAILALYGSGQFIDLIDKKFRIYPQYLSFVEEINDKFKFLMFDENGLAQESLGTQISFYDISFFQFKQKILSLK